MTGSLCRKGEACTENQKKAVKKTNGPIIIVAGPGAGKTRVLVERVAYLVKRKHVPPENILVITFTEKAADELKARLLNCVGLDAELMHISTVHSFCSTILKNHPEDHEYGGGFEVLDEESQLIFLRANFYRLGLNRHVKMRDVPEVMEFFNMCTENCVDPERLLEKVDRKYRGLCQCYRDYLELLKSGKKIDFPCLEKEAWMLLKSSSRVLESVREKYRYMMIDEYQDTSPLQERIFRTIAGKNSNICLVGDEDQSIYGFRGATPENFIRFKDEFHADLVFLICNARQAMEIFHANAYDSGSRGLGADSGPICSSMAALPYLTGKVTYGFGDAGSRRHMGLGDEDVMVSIPGGELPRIVSNLEEMKRRRSFRED